MVKTLRTRHPSALDCPSLWNQQLRPWFDVEGYQQRINNRAGLNRDGRPVVRLVWGQSVEQHAFFETTPRYWTRRQRTGPGRFTWYTVPRWIFERRLEPEQYFAAWEAKRYSITDPTQGSLRCGDCGWGDDPEIIEGRLYCRKCMSTNYTGGAVVDKGPPPAEYYTFMMECAKHEGMQQGPQNWPACCNRAWYTDRMRCWGEYRQPNDFDLQVISQSVREMEAAKGVDPYRPLSSAELEEIELAANMQVERAEEAMRVYEQEMSADFNKRYKHLLMGERSPAFIDLGGMKTASGIILTDS